MYNRVYRAVINSPFFNVHVLDFIVWFYVVSVILDVGSSVFMVEFCSGFSEYNILYSYFGFVYWFINVGFSALVFYIARYFLRYVFWSLYILVPVTVVHTWCFLHNLILYISSAYLCCA